MRGGRTDGALARRAGFDRAHVNAVRNGRVEPTVATALAIARAFGLAVAAVFGAATRRRLT
jgi:DNA-binding XRE family transcriptional regulator